MNKIELIGKSAHLLITATIFAVPFFFLSLTPNAYDWNKQILILAVGLTLALLWSIRNVLEGATNLVWTHAAPLLLGLLATTIASTFLNPDPVSGLMGTTMLITGVVIFSLLVTQFLTGEGRLWHSAVASIAYPLILSALILTTLDILQFLGIWKSLAPWSWAGGNQWTPAGSRYSHITVIATAFAWLVAAAVREFFSTEKKHLWRLLSRAILAVILVPSLILFTTGMLRENKPQTGFLRLPYSAGWQVATGVMGESLKSTFLGVGPENFSSAFTKYKPAFINTTDLWNTIFFRSSNIPFQLIATTGILGLLFWCLIALYIVRKLLEEVRSPARTVRPETAGMVTILITQIFLPHNLYGWLLLGALLGIPDKQTKKTELKTDPLLMLAIVATATAALTYLGYRAYRGELLLQQSFQALAQNKVVDAYNLQVQALNKNPKKFNYHQIFSQTNLLIANSLLRTLSPLSKEELGKLSDQEKQRRTQTQKKALTLIQKAINEAKRATVIAPHRFEAWQNQAETYRALIGLSDGAQSWAIASYQRAISLNPLATELRISLGGVLLGLGQIDEAIYNFRLATQTKPDHANAWYNLAAAYKKAGENQKAAIALQNAIAALPAGSSDREKAQKELEELKKMLSEEQKKALKEATPSSALKPQRPETFGANEASPSSSSRFSPFVKQ